MKEASSSGSKSVVKTSSKTTITKIKTTRTEEKKGKKNFSLPGQKHEPPEERDPLRIFYETLHEQRPDSEMAAIWMMEHGLLDASHAKKALDLKQRRQQQEKNATPNKSITQSKESSKVVTKTSLSNGKNQHQEKNGTTMKSTTHSKDFSKVHINKATLSNGNSHKLTEQNGKRKRDLSSDDDDFIAKPTVKKKLKPKP